MSAVLCVLFASLLVNLIQIYIVASILQLYAKFQAYRHEVVQTRTVVSINSNGTVKEITVRNEYQDIKENTGGIEFNLMSLPDDILLEHHENLETDVSELIGDLKNLKTLALSSQNFKFEDIIHRLEPNSLHSLYLKIVQSQNLILSSSLESILKYQESSLRRLYISSNGELDFNRKSYGLEEFDQIYRKTHSCYRSKQLLQDIRQVRNMISKGTDYRNLHQVLLNE
ncbi:hypothetical protein JA1_000567 [Spathaspora sp. JA1]|nr:hypothetical protein JA1_000567 [Spathaspora sp. JA1]